MLFFAGRGGRRPSRGLEFAERLERLVVSPADADFIAGDPLDFIRENELVANFERAGEGVVFEARDAEEPPPVMGKQLDLLRLGFRLRVPLVAEVGDEMVEIGDGLGGQDNVTAREGVGGAIGGRARFAFGRAGSGRVARVFAVGVDLPVGGHGWDLLLDMRVGPGGKAKATG